MPFFGESREQIYGDIINDILDSTNITRSSPGSKTKALVDAVSKKMGRMYSTFDLNFGQAFLDGATGRWLDFFGDMMGVERLGEIPARASALDRNVKFYVNAGTFGNINGGSSINIPSGTVISTQSGGTGIKYVTTVATVLASSAREGYVSVQSVGTGDTGNVGKSQLRYHTFTTYTDSQDGSLKVTNEADIVNGANLETNANYKFRIANRITEVENANDLAIRLAALSVPGVADIVFIPFHRGIGTFDIIIKAVTPTVSAGLISSVQAAVAGVASTGIVPRVRAPVEVGVSLVGTLTYKRQLSTEEERDILNSATTNVTNYINSLDIAEEFIVQEILERVLSTSDLIKKVGSTTKPFDNLYLYKPSRLEDTKVRSILIDDYTPKSDDRLIVENKYAGATPILLRSA